MARSPAKRVFGTLLFIVAAAVTLGFLALLYADSVNDTSFPFVDQKDSAALVVAIALAIILVILLLMLLIRRWDRRAEVAESGEVFFIPEDIKAPPAATTAFESRADVVVYDLAKVPQSKGSWAEAEKDGSQYPFYFPRSVAAGVYVNDYIPVGGQRVLKLRTLMAGPYDPAYVDDSPPRSRAKAPAAPAVMAAGRGRQRLVLQEAEAVTAPPSGETYYDYAGDNHDIEDIEGIGAVYGAKLRALGVHTTARLAYEEAGKLAERMELPRKTVEQWKHMAELIKVSGIGPQYAEALVRAGIEGIAELKRRSAAKIADQVNAYLDTLDTNVLGVKITEKRVEGWQASAKPMRRMRLQVPAQ
jgi:predicted flap endonuclease-1-like 5' DNA nuclease